jgi:hypothetical protein
MSIMRRVRFSAIIVVVATVACHGSSPAPTQPTQPPPSQAGSPSPATLRGTVIENTSQARRPIPGAHVFVVDLADGPYGNFPWYMVDTDAAGRFSIARLPPGRPVKLTAYVGSTSPRLNASGLSQVCAVDPTPGIDTAIEIDLFSREAVPRILVSPRLTGVIVEGAAARPAADLAVIYSSNGDDGADVYTRTDASGRYTFWALPEGLGYVLPFCARDTSPGVSAATTYPLEIRGDTTLNIACP